MVKYLAILTIAAASYLAYFNYPESHGPGVVAKKSPKITRLTWHKPFEFKGAKITPVKRIQGEIRVIKRKRYFFDKYEKYAPVDALVSWGKMSDERNLEFIHADLSGRGYDFELSRPPLDQEQIIYQSDLWHLIPSTRRMDEEIKKLRNGNIIRVKGLLVDVTFENDFTWKTAKEIKKKEITRYFKEKGYIIWVEEFSVL